PKHKPIHIHSFIYYTSLMLLNFHSLPASVAFSVDQQQCLSQLAATLEGYTKKQQNPYPPACLPWAVWLIARVGGWSGYVSGRPPGMPTLVHGLRQFEAMFLGWKLAHNPVVCTR
ncbi:hypothetical protein QUA20_31550, partial [Microcoleus sp. Pol7_A1]